jgi:Lipase (class 3)/C2 domain
MLSIKFTKNAVIGAFHCKHHTRVYSTIPQTCILHQKNPSVAASRQFSSTQQYARSRFATSAVTTERVSTELDPSCDFDWMLGLALAGCAFEAYNGLETGPEGSHDPLHSESAGGTRVTYLDPDFLRKKMDGVLEITIVGAKRLKSADMFGGKSDPYCIVSVGGSSARTPTIQENNDPTWEHKCLLFVQNLKSQRLNIRVLDEDFANSDDLLGSGVRGIADLADGKEIEIEVPLTGGTGSVTLKLQYEPFTQDEDLLRAATVARMGGPVVGTPAEAVLSSPWRTLCKAVIPTSAADDYLGLDALAYIDNPAADTQVWIFWNQPQKRIVVAFRGTESSRLKDVLTDLQLNPTSLDPEGGVETSNDSPMGAMVKGFGAMLKGIRKGENDGDKAISGQDEDKPEGEMWAHSGFYKAYKAVQAEVIQIVDAITAGEAKEWSIFVTGHSLGGALSTLGAYELATRRQWKGGKPKVVNYSYGSPRVGNRVFAYSFNKAVPNAWRVVNNNDAVALVPRLVGYAHVGHLVRLTPEGDVIVELHSATSTGEGADMAELAAAVVSAPWAGKDAKDGVIDSAEDLSAVIKAEIVAMNNLLDGSGVAEHLEPLYLENLETAIEKYFTKDDVKK